METTVQTFEEYLQQNPATANRSVGIRWLRYMQECAKLPVDPKDVFDGNASGFNTAQLGKTHRSEFDGYGGVRILPRDSTDADNIEIPFIKGENNADSFKKAVTDAVQRRDSIT